MTRPKEPQNLPWCEYPKASETDKHRLQTLPEKLLPINFDNVIKYRSNRFKPAVIASEGPLKLLELASILADSFSINDPMNRHICPSRNVPVTLEGGVHRDAFGSSEFGPWTTQNIFFWFVRLFALTNANDPNHTIGIREDTVRLSLAIFDKDRNVIGAAINTVLTFKEKPIRIGDPFMQAVLNHI